MVPQDCVLFHDTIHYNLHYGNFAASEEQLQQAARAAQIHDTISRWPEGYATQVRAEPLLIPFSRQPSS